MKNYYLITTSYDHLKSGIKKGFVQQRHEKRLSDIKKNDYVVLYASKKKFDSNEKMQMVCGICQIIDDDNYNVNVKGTKYFRRKVKVFKFTPYHITDILNKLKFIKNKKYWGLYLISGFRKLSDEDFKTFLLNGSK